MRMRVVVREQTQRQQRHRRVAPALVQRGEQAPRGLQHAMLHPQVIPRHIPVRWTDDLVKSGGKRWTRPPPIVQVENIGGGLGSAVDVTDYHDGDHMLQIPKSAFCCV